MLWRRLLVAMAAVKKGGFTPFNIAWYARQQSGSTNYDLITVSYAPPAQQGGNATLVFSAPVVPANMKRQLFGTPTRTSAGQVPLFGRDWIAGTGPGGALAATDPRPYATAMPGPIFGCSYSVTTGNVTTLEWDNAYSGDGPNYGGGGAIKPLVLPYCDPNDKTTFAKSSTIMAGLSDTYGHTYPHAYTAQQVALMAGVNYGFVQTYNSKDPSDPTYPTTTDADGNTVPRPWDGTSADASNYVGSAAGGFSTDGTVPDVTCYARPNGDGTYTADGRNNFGIPQTNRGGTNIPGTWIGLGGIYFNIASQTDYELVFLRRSGVSSASFGQTVTQGVHSYSYAYGLSYATVAAVQLHNNNLGGVQVTFGTTVNGTTALKIQVVSPPVAVRDDPVVVGLYGLSDTALSATPTTTAATGLAVAHSYFAPYSFTTVNADGTLNLPVKISNLGAGYSGPDNTVALNFYDGGSGTQTKTGYSYPGTNFPVGGLGTSTAKSYSINYSGPNGAVVTPTSPSGYYGSASNPYPGSAAPSWAGTFGTALFNSSTASQYGTNCSVAVKDYFQGLTYTWIFSAGPYAWFNTGDDYLSFGGVTSSYFNGSSTVATVQKYGSVLLSGDPGTVLAQTAGTSASNNNVTYFADPTKNGVLTLPCMWATAPNALVPVPLDAASLLLVSPLPGATVTVNGTTTASYAMAGLRNGTAYVRASITSLVETVIPVSQIPGQNIPEATQTWAGKTWKHVGLSRVTTTYYAAISVTSRVATISPYSVAKAVSYFEIAQALDSNGNPTNLFASWTNPGAARSAALSTSSSQAGYNGLPAFADLITVNNVDYIVDLKSFLALDVAANAASAANPSVMKVIPLPPNLGASWYAMAIPNLGGILVVDASNARNWLSLDLGATWVPTTLTGTTGWAAVTGGRQAVVGSPLFKF